MKKMRFLPELAAFLKEHGYIYTVRKYRYSLNENLVQVDGAGVCERQLIHSRVSSKEDLEPYVDRSGFKTVDDWWKAIKSFNKGHVGPFYLYEITLEDTHEEK